jgi:hypothetical protein
MIKKSLLIVFCLLSITICSFVFAADSEVTLDTNDSSSGFTVKDSLGDPVMSARGDGNVGIGTTNPEAKLHIGGTPGVDGIKFPDGTVQTTAGGSNVVLQTAFKKSTAGVHWGDPPVVNPALKFSSSAGRAYVGLDITFTPKSASSIIRVRSSASMMSQGATNVYLALFMNEAAYASAVGVAHSGAYKGIIPSPSGTVINTLFFEFYTGSTSPITFSHRVGQSEGGGGNNLAINREVNGIDQNFGGTLANTYIYIEEVDG